MGSALKLNAQDLRNLAEALDSLTEITKSTGVKFAVYDNMTVAVGDSGSWIKVKEQDGKYVIEDYLGE